MLMPSSVRDQNPRALLENLHPTIYLNLPQIRRAALQASNTFDYNNPGFNDKEKLAAAKRADEYLDNIQSRNPEFGRAISSIRREQAYAVGQELQKRTREIVARDSNTRSNFGNTKQLGFNDSVFEEALQLIPLPIRSAGRIAGGIGLKALDAPGNAKELGKALQAEAKAKELQGL